MTDVVIMGRKRRVALFFLILFYGIAGVAHLVAADALVRIVPAWVPAPRAVVVATGLCELAGAWALCTPRWRLTAGRALALYAVCVFPANLKHAISDLGAGTGLPPAYHLPRLALQPVVIWWALWASGVTDWPSRQLAPIRRVP